MSVDILSPEDFFGHRLGAERKLAHWDRIGEYFWELDKSPMVKVTELGKSTEGNTFLLVIISSEENMERLEEIREMSWKLAHPRGVPREEIDRIIKEGKTVVSMSMSIHATEVGGTQMSPELAWELITLPENKEILDSTVLLMFPCFNPDGQIMVTEFYNKYLGTEYEGTSPPWLYHKYTGHDNNRDAMHLKMVESQMVSKVMYLEWSPQAYIDYHHMGSYGARFYIAPFANPIDDKVDPLIWTEQELYGGLTHVMLEEQGIYGVESAATYPGEFMPTFNYVPCWHNICGMLTESASAKLATPIYIHYHQLRGSRRGRPEYRTQMGFPHPWEGGWWKLRDIVEQQKISAYGTLKAASVFRELILGNMYKKASHAIQKGLEEAPFAFITKPDQHDELVGYKLMKALMDMGVEVSRSQREFVADGVVYPRGIYVVFASQHCRPYLVSLLKRTYYHLGAFSKYPDGSPVVPYDLSTYTIAEFMGVRLHEVEKPFKGNFEILTSIRYPRGFVDDDAPNGWILNNKINDGFLAVNRLLRKGVTVHRVTENVETEAGVFEPGSFYIPKADGLNAELGKLSKRCHIRFEAAPPAIKSKAVKMLRIGMYQRYYGGNADEGWTRWLLEEYRFRYKTLMDKDIQRGRLTSKYDVIILPSDAKELLTGDKVEEYFEKRWGGGSTMPNYPPEYRSGLGEEGVKKLKEFVKEGGTLLAIGSSCDFAIEELELPVTNVLKDVKNTDFVCPGSTLRVNVNKEHPLAWGVQEDLLIIFRHHPALSVRPRVNNDDYKVVLSYPEKHIMESGWLTGEKYLSNKAALVEAKMGKGKVVLYGFQPQMRAQPDATFKLLFNALLG
ncbi:MAG: M14 family zinc carboxypeptidase [Candidatus Bathyarchaeota archaeon]|nr:M14 family zinc carboxypeptidase [Candidatus Bathyarchaeota archaeon]